MELLFSGYPVQPNSAIRFEVVSRETDQCPINITLPESHVSFACLDQAGHDGFHRILWGGH
jgi:hypothetical protein